MAVVCAPAWAATAVPGPHLRPDGHVSLAWLYGGTAADYRAQIDQAVGLSVISPTWWYLDADQPGALELATDDELVTYAHDRGIAVWPLFGNHIDPDLTDQVLRDPALRQQVVQGIVAEVRRSGVDGVNVDFENLHDDTRFLLTQLVTDLKAALPDLVISVDVTAMTDTWVLDNWSTAFDREGLARAADYVMLMAYDQHNSLRRDGPVAGLQWVTESTEFLLRTVPADKIILGLPFYSRDWADDPTATQGVDLDATMGMAAMARRVAERSQATTFDPVAGQDLHTYTDQAGRPHRVWLEDIASLQRKTALLGSHGLAGIAAWRAGFEQPEVWLALDAQLSTLAQPPAPTPLPTPTPPAIPTPPALAPPPMPPQPSALQVPPAGHPALAALPTPASSTSSRTTPIGIAGVVLAAAMIGVAGGLRGRRR
ncbi:MAG: glycosyl hydrolase family 18 protein [Euzebya sp.]